MYVTLLIHLQSTPVAALGLLASKYFSASLPYLDVYSFALSLACDHKQPLLQHRAGQEQGSRSSRRTVLTEHTANKADLDWAAGV